MSAQKLLQKTDLLSLADRLIRMAEEMEHREDQENGGKLRQLAQKLRDGEWSIAFCGHFSAGKSTMINTLLGRDLLPSNPIPTSANVVKIRGGEKAARVYTRHNGVLTFDPDTEMEQLKQYAVDGDTVEWVEIQYPGTFLDERTSLLDTPGIDSTDAAHKIATESALHLADAVIYMMDYNHVQAEENFNFTKTLKDRGKPVYLVINMIDKHIDFELDFDSYKESVEEAFATWNIRPDGIFYTSLAEPDHPENQYAAFRQKLLELMQEKEQLIADSALHAVQHLIGEHARRLQHLQANERQALEGQLELDLVGVDGRNPQAVAAALEQAEKELTEQRALLDQAKQRMQRELDSLLENARLTYYSTNEAAGRYLESRQPGFKVGFLFAGKKTEEERIKRLDALLADFREKVSANLDFHFKELLTRLPQEYGIRDENYHAAVHGVTVEVTAQLLAEQVKPGAGTREYVMNYCQDISHAVKLQYRRLGMDFIDQILNRLRERSEAEVARVKERLATLQQLHAAHQQLDQMDQEIREQTNRLQAMLT